jgi:hypothetical protein
LQVVLKAFDAQAEVGFIGRVEHSHFLVKRSSIEVAVRVLRSTAP